MREKVTERVWGAIGFTQYAQPYPTYELFIYSFPPVRDLTRERVRVGETPGRSRQWLRREDGDTAESEPAVCHLPSPQPFETTGVSGFQTTQADTLCQSAARSDQKERRSDLLSLSSLPACNRSEPSPWISQSNRRWPWNRRVWTACQANRQGVFVCVGQQELTKKGIF